MIERALGIAMMVSSLAFADERPAPPTPETPKPKALKLPSIATPVPTTIPDGPPKAILQHMEQALNVKAQSHESDEVRKTLEAAFARILTAADKVLAHRDATAAEKAEARQFQVSILYQGARMSVAGSLKRLEDIAATLDSSAPKSEVASLAAFLLIKVKYDGEFGLEPTALPAIEKYIARFPTDEAVLELLDDVALTAEMTGRNRSARQAMELVGQTFPKHQAAERLPGALRRLDLVGKPMTLVGMTLDNRKLDVADLKGRVVIVDFWATWCAPCVAELPNLRSLYGRYHDQGLEVVGVPLDDDLGALKEFLGDGKTPWPQVFPPDEKERGFSHPVAARYGISGIPTMFLIDRDGKVVSTCIRGRALDERVSALIAQPAIAKITGAEAKRGTVK